MEEAYKNSIDKYPSLFLILALMIMCLSFFPIARLEFPDNPIHQYHFIDVSFKNRIPFHFLFLWFVSIVLILGYFYLSRLDDDKLLFYSFFLILLFIISLNLTLIFCLVSVIVQGYDLLEVVEYYNSIGEVTSLHIEVGVIMIIIVLVSGLVTVTNLQMRITNDYKSKIFSILVLLIFPIFEIILGAFTYLNLITYTKTTTTLVIVLIFGLSFFSSLFLLKYKLGLNTKEFQDQTNLEEIKKSIFGILPNLTLIFKQQGIPLMEIQTKIGYNINTISLLLREMISNREIQGYLDHRQTITDFNDDILYLEENPCFVCELCKNSFEIISTNIQCGDCSRFVCQECYDQMRNVGHTECPYCGSETVKENL